MCYGVVWCGDVLCGAVLCGVVLCGVVWCCVVLCSVVWCGVVFHKHDVNRLGTRQCSVVSYCYFRAGRQ